MKTYRSKDGYNEKAAKRRRDRRDNDPLFRLADNLRRRINIVLSEGGYSKKSSSVDIIGCSFEELLYWLGDTEGMDIDHIIPLSYANTEEELLYLNHWTNLQLLAPDVNKSKGARIDLDYQKPYLDYFNKLFR